MKGKKRNKELMRITSNYNVYVDEKLVTDLEIKNFIINTLYLRTHDKDQRPGA